MMEQHEIGNARETPHYNEGKRAARFQLMPCGPPRALMMLIGARMLHVCAVIVDTQTYAAHLPASLFAVFILDSSDAAAVQHARAVHSAFLARYPQISPVDMPLVRLSLLPLLGSDSEETGWPHRTGRPTTLPG